MLLKRKSKKTRESQKTNAKVINFEHNQLNIHDLYLPDGMVINYDNIRLGADMHSRIYVLSGMPRELMIGWLDEIFYRVGDVDVSIHMEPAPDRTVLDTILKKETQLRAQEALDIKAGNITRLPELRIAIADYAGLREQVQLSRDRIFFIENYIAVHAETEEELRHKCNALEDVLARKNIQIRALVLRQKEGLLSTMPCCNNKIDNYWKNLTSGAAACCLPASTVQVGHPNGIPIGFNRTTKSPILVNRFSGEHIVSNPNMFISGMSGSGKSVTGRTLALREAAVLGVKFAFVDPEGEYIQLTQEVGGQICRIIPGSFSGMNILDIEPSTEEDENGIKKEYVNIQDKVAEIQGLVSAVIHHMNGRSLEPREVAVLEDCLLQEYIDRGITAEPESLYENGIKKQMPTITSLHERLKTRSETLTDILTPMLRNGSLGMFDGQTTLKLADSPMVCFSMKALNVEFVKFFATYVVLGWLWQKFAQRGGKKIKKSVLVDEAWMFMRYSEAANILETLARRGRKHGCGLLILTQRFEEFSQTHAGRSVIESCATVMVLKQEEHAAGAAVEYFKLSGGCKDLLVKAGPGEGILRLSGSVTGINVIPATFEWKYVETKMIG